MRHHKGCQCIRCDYGGFVADTRTLKAENDARDEQLGREPPPDLYSRMTPEQRAPYRARWRGRWSASARASA